MYVDFAVQCFRLFVFFFDISCSTNSIVFIAWESYAEVEIAVVKLRLELGF